MNDPCTGNWNSCSSCETFWTSPQIKPVTTLGGVLHSQTSANVKTGGGRANKSVGTRGEQFLYPPESTCHDVFSCVWITGDWMALYLIPASLHNSLFEEVQLVQSASLTLASLLDQTMWSFGTLVIFTPCNENIAMLISASMSSCRFKMAMPPLAVAFYCFKVLLVALTM